MLNRKELTNRITNCIVEGNRLREENDRGQNDRRIADLAKTRIAAVKALREIKLGR